MAKAYIPVKLDKIRNFHYGMRELSLIEDILDKNLSDIDFENLKIKELASVIWAGLQHEDKELTPESVMDLIDEHSSLSEVAEVLGRAMTEAFGVKNA